MTFKFKRKRVLTDAAGNPWNYTDVLDIEDCWRKLGEVPVSSDDRIKEEFVTPWVTWPKGCPIDDIWSWFDSSHPYGVKYLMYGVRDASKEAT